MISNNEKYWKDYTIFIEIVESTTHFSPANLLKNYQELIAELDSGKEYYEDEWDYEYEEDMYIRKQIQRVIENPNLSNNILFEEFQNKIKIISINYLQNFLKQGIIIK